MNIESYKTDVTKLEDADILVQLLQFVISDCVMNFDLEDSDHVLKIQTNREIKDMVYGVFTKQGFNCQIM